MSEKTEMQKVTDEIIRFMRGRYALDEVPGKHYEADCLRFRQGKKTIVTVIFYEDHYGFLVVYGKAEREKFEKQRDEFPQSIIEIYDNATPITTGNGYHTGWIT